MICPTEMTFERLFAFALFLKRARLSAVFAVIIWLSGQTSFAGTHQIDVANKLVAKMMVEVESILTTDINDDGVVDTADTALLDAGDDFGFNEGIEFL